MSRKNIAIIGGGPSGLMAAHMLSLHHDVSIYDKEKGVGQKFLVAGKGGFNITNALTGEALAAKYTPTDFLKEALHQFDSTAVRNWLTEIGIETYVGSSGRVFPIKGLTPSDVLKAWKQRLEEQGVIFNLKHEFAGFDENEHVVMKVAREKVTIEADYYIFALGGASWPVTGSDGKWIKTFSKNKINTIPFQASNCGVLVDWPETIQKNHAGKPLKNIAIKVNEVWQKGEAMITEYGLEGNAIYPLVPHIRSMLAIDANAHLYLDLKPFNTEEQLLQKIQGKTAFTTKNYATVFSLDVVQLALIKAYTSKETFLSPEQFALSLKNICIPVTKLRPVEEAISTIGGMDLSELNADFSFKKRSNCFAVGEMLDWDAPTGGFLLQGCFSMGNWVAKSIEEKINS